MAENITLNNLANLQNETTAVGLINANNAAITTAFQDVVSRSGTVPNTMLTTLDMNNQRIVNVGAPANASDAARLGDLTNSPVITSGLVSGGAANRVAIFGSVNAITAGVSLNTGQALMGNTGSTPVASSSPSFTGSVTAATGLIATTGGLTVGAGGAAITGASSINGATAVTGALSATTTLSAPTHIGGSGTTGVQLTIQSTSAVGTTDTIKFSGGNNGGTQFANLSANTLNIAGTLLSGGYSRVAADVTYLSNTTFSTVLTSPTLVAAGNYGFHARLFCTMGAGLGGIKAQVSTTTTGGTVIYDGYQVDGNTIVGHVQATAYTTPVANATTAATTALVEINGFLSVGAGGTISIQAAQNVSNVTASLVKRGSWLQVWQVT